MSWLTATVMRYIAGALLVACVALGVRGCTLSAQRDAAVSARDAAQTERDAWKGKAAGCVAANAAYGDVLDRLRAEQARRDREAAAAAAKAAEQVRAAQADARTAQAKLADYRRRFAGKPADCAAALARLDAVCPALGGY